MPEPGPGAARLAAPPKEGLPPKLEEAIAAAASAFSITEKVSLLSYFVEGLIHQFMDFTPGVTDDAGAWLLPRLRAQPVDSCAGGELFRMGRLFEMSRCH